MRGFCAVVANGVVLVRAEEEEKEGAKEAEEGVEGV